MVMNGNMVVRLAHASAHAWQYVACNPERLSSEQVLDLICCFPLQQLGRLLLSVWTYLCYDPTPSNPFYLSSSSSSSSSSLSSGLDFDADSSDFHDIREHEHPHVD